MSHSPTPPISKLLDFDGRTVLVTGAGTGEIQWQVRVAQGELRQREIHQMPGSVPPGPGEGTRLGGEVVVVRQVKVDATFGAERGQVSVGSILLTALERKRVRRAPDDGGDEQCALARFVR